MTAGFHYLDPLYGRVAFDEAFRRLIAAPVVQRLRHIRLSNIDSLAMPGIANVSRYEHVLGVGHLAANVAVGRKLNHFECTALIAAGILHDWAITAFGHLVEEAFGYLGTNFNHERRLYDIIAGDNDVAIDVGGIGRQVLCGRQTGLRPWASRAVGIRDADNLLGVITQAVLGKGRLGGLIAGQIDLDNIDNVYRIAFHMGLDVDRSVPVLLAKGIVDILPSGELVFANDVREQILAWGRTRRAVYMRLMPAEPDFGLKLMILYGTIAALQSGEIGPQDWHLTDLEFVGRLLQSSQPRVRDAVSRWMAGEVWDTSPLFWMSGDRPPLPRLLEFSNVLESALKRPCLAYGIKDKRERILRIFFSDGHSEDFGRPPDGWLFGVGSSKRSAFSNAQIRTLLELAGGFFEVAVKGPATPVCEVTSNMNGQLALI